MKLRLLYAFLGLVLLTFISQSSLAQAPGNVTSNLNLWLKADAGVSGTTPVTGWTDQSPMGNNATVPTNGPDLLTNQINSNPVLEFDRANSEYLQVTGGILGVGSYTDAWVYYVSKANTQVTNTIFNESLAGSEHFASLNPWSNGQTYFQLGNSSTGAGGGRINNNAGQMLGKFSLWSMGISTGTSTPSGTNKTIYRDGLAVLSNPAADNTVTGNNSNFDIGGRWAGGNSSYLDGQIAELIVYTGVPSALEQEKVQSYLALKYGITKNSTDNGSTGAVDERDYFASDGTIIWDYSSAGPYINDITGIGRDDNSSLSQLRSENINNTDGVALDHGVAFTSDRDFIVWANNGAITTSTDVPAGYDIRSNRIWQISTTGTPGVVSFSIDLSIANLQNTGSAADYALLIDGDGTFNAGATTHTTGATLVGNLLTFTNVSLSDGDLLAVAIDNATATAAPGAVTTDLRLWLKADAGVSGASPITGWADQSTLGHVGSIPTNGPDLLTDQLNFNPVLDFTSANSEYVQITNGILGTNTYADAWVYYVSKADVQQNNTIFNETLSGAEYFASLNPWSNGQTYIQFGNSSTAAGGGRLNANANATPGNYNMWTMGVSDNNASTPNGTHKAISRDGLVVLNNDVFDGSILGANGNFDIGGRWAGGNSSYLDGQIAELIVYTGVPSILEQEKVQSYLALKYGISKASPDNGTSGATDERDYFASDGTIIWDYSSNAPFINDITGIGRDDNSTLDQRKSTSINQDGIVIDKGGAFGSDQDFLLWANNGEITTSTDVPGGYAERSNRVWKVQVNGTPGTVSVTIDLDAANLQNTGVAGDYALLVDADGTFSSGATIHTTGASLVGNELTFTNVNFADGDQFALGFSSAIATVSPGNVSTNLRLWLKADAGITGATPVTGWTDQSTLGNDATVPTSGPDLLTNQLNGNPVLDFTSANSEYLRINNGILGNSSYSDAWVYYVSKADVLQNNTIFNETLSGNEYFASLNPWSNGQSYIQLGNSGNGAGGGRLNGNAGAAVGIYNLWTMGVTDNSASAPNGTNKTIYKDGRVALTNSTFDPAVTGVNGNLDIGGRWAGGNSSYLDGQIAELIVYTAVPTSLEQEQIQSYLALKYGISKASTDNSGTGGTDERDYFASDGTVIWDYSTQGDFVNDVTGIGRDDATGLDQQRSTSINTDGVTIDKGGAFASDRDYLIWSSNAEITTSTDVPGGFDVRSNRTWKVSTNGTPGAVTFSIDLDLANLPETGSVADYALLIDADGTFASGAITHTTGATLLGSTLTFTGVNFSDGDFFAIGISNAISPIAPGSVGANLRLWLKADAGVTGTSPVTGWTDQSTLGNDATVAANGPDLLTDQINFNPALDFTSADAEHLQVTNGILGNSNYSDAWVYYVSKADAIQNNTIFNETLNGNEYFASLNPWSNNQSYIQLGNSGTGAGGGRLNSNAGASAGIYNLWTMGISDDAAGTPNGTHKTIYKDGLATLTNGAFDPSVTGGNQNFFIGGRWAGGNSSYLDGQIAELIVYTGVPSIIEQEKVQSYLAIKYGISKQSVDNAGSPATDERDYFASDETILLDYSAAGAYINDITGIGRDDNSLLDQRKSKSIGTLDGVALDKGVAFGTDKDFILWANNGAITTSTDVPAGYEIRSNRIWKASVTGTPGTVTLSVDLDVANLQNTGSVADYALLIDTDETFATGATVHTTGATLVGNELTFTNVSLSDGNFFAFAINNITPDNAPGSVAQDLRLWLKADAGVAGATPVTGWTDQSTIGNNATVPTNGPDLLTNEVNGNPALDFTSANSEYLQVTNGIMRGNTYSDAWVYYVSKSDAIQNNTIFNETLAGNEYFASLNPWSNNQSYIQLGNSGTAAGGGRLNGNADSQTGVYNLWTLGVSADNSGTPSGTHKAIYRDGILELTNDNFDGSVTGSNQNFDIGGRWAGGNSSYLDGQIAELIVYTNAPTALEQEQVQSYLALKYGISKGSADNTGTGGTDERDYFASDASVIWDYSTSLPYINSVTGIGRDDVSLLDQQSSRNLSTDDGISMDKGGAFSNDKDFIVWANDGDITVVTDVPAGYDVRSNRIWKVAVSGTPGAVSVSIDLDVANLQNTGSVADYALLIDSDETFATGATAHTTGATLVGSVLTFTNVNFSDGDFFSIAINNFNFPKGPGNVSTNLRLWLRADQGVAGTSPVTGWTDQSTIGNNAVVAANGPDLLTDQINGNPALDFNSSNAEHLQVTNGILGTNTYNDAWVYYVSRADAQQNNTIFNENLAGNEYFASLNPWSNGQSYIQLGNSQTGGGGGRLNGNGGAAINAVDIWSLGVSSNATSTPNGTHKGIFKNGSLVLSNNTFDPTVVGSNQNFYIGGRWTGANSTYLDGQIAELIVYTGGIPTPLDQEKIQSYLAIKYGVNKSSVDNSGTVSTDERDYFASDDAVIFDFSAAGIYTNGITGIGRDDASELDQRRSRNLTADDGVSIDKGGAFAADKDYLLWANNGAITISTDVPAGYDARTNRIWQTSVTGTPGAVTFTIDLTVSDVQNTGSAADYALLIDSDETFATGATVHTTGVSLVGNELTFTNVNFSDGDYFAIAINNYVFPVSPGAVSQNLRLWLKADAGVTGTTNVSAWADQSTIGNNATTTTNGPELLADQLNFRPALDFNSSNAEHMQITNGILEGNTYNDAWVYYVSRADVQQNNTVFNENMSGNEYFASLNVWSNNQTYYQLGNSSGGSGGGRINNNVSVNLGEYNFWTMGITDNAGSAPNGTNKVIVKNGEVVLTNSNADAASSGNNQNFYIGGRWTGGNSSYLDGQIAELIVYTDAVPTVAEQERIHSYLSMKYGLDKATVDNPSTVGLDERDYFASDGTIVWDYTDNSTFDTRITTLARDDQQGLMQTRSQNVNDRTVLEIDNPSNLDDMEYFVVADNDLASSANNMVDIPTGLAEGLQARLDRVWRVEENNGDVGTVDLTFDHPEWNYVITDIRLLIDKDGDGSFADETVAGGGVIAGAIEGSIRFLGVNLADGERFTIGTINQVQSPLPIELLSFEAQPINNTYVQLDWQTATEINNDFFTVERSVDLQTWEKVLEMDGAGNSNQTLKYQAEDYNPYRGVSYYRLKQTDYDGQYSYSPVKTVDLDAQEEGAITVAPNPTKNRVTISASASELEVLAIYNVAGQDLTKFARIVERLDTQVILDLSDLAPGLYTIKTKTQGSKVYKQ